MMRLWDALKSLQSGLIPISEVRAEAWALGGRHRGEVVDGARAELLAPGITSHRSMLLRAVIRSSKGGRRPPILGPKAKTDTDGRGEG
jgi:hypothetical protein